MDNNRPVAEEARRSLDQRGVRVDVFVAERILRNLAVLATQVTDLASLRLRLIARRIFAALVGVKVGEGFDAVAAGGHGSNVDMVDGWAKFVGVGQVFKVSVKLDAFAVRTGLGTHRSANVAAETSVEKGILGQDSLVDDVGIVRSLGCVLGVGGAEGGEASDEEGCQAHDDESWTCR